MVLHTCIPIGTFAGLDRYLANGLVVLSKDEACLDPLAVEDTWQPMSAILPQLVKGMSSRHNVVSFIDG